MPAVRPPCTCQVGQDDSRNNVTPIATVPRNLFPNSATNGSGRRGMLGLLGLRGALGQLGTPGIGGISLNTRVFMRPPASVNSIVRQANNENEADDNSIVT